MIWYVIGAAARVMLAPGAADPARLAVDEVKALLYNPDQLSRVAHYRADYAAKKQQLELSLSSAVRTQVNDTIGIIIVSIIPYDDTDMVI